MGEDGAVAWLYFRTSFIPSSWYFVVHTEWFGAGDLFNDGFLQKGVVANKDFGLLMAFLEGTFKKE